MTSVHRFLLYVITGFVVALVTYTVLQVFFYRPLSMLQNRIDDRQFALRDILAGMNDHDDTDGIVIVDIDDTTLRRLGRNITFWPRRNFGEVIGALRRENADLVFLDVLFAEGGGVVDNQVFADSLQAAGNVIAGFSVNLEPGSLGKRPEDTVLNERFLAGLAHAGPMQVIRLESNEISLSYREMVRSSRNIGFVNYMPDRDGIIRHFPLYLSFMQWQIPAAPLQLWMIRSGFEETPPEFTSKGVRFGGTIISTDRHTFMRINYPRASAYRYVSFADVLQGNYPEGTFTGRVVLIGSSSPALGDIKRIPDGRLIPGVEVHAAALSTLMSGRFITVLPDGLLLIAVLILSMAASVFFSHLHPLKTGIPVLIAGIGLLWAISVICFISHGLLVNITIPAIVLAAVYLVATHTWFVDHLSHGRYHF